MNETGEVTAGTKDVASGGGRLKPASDCGCGSKANGNADAKKADPPSYVYALGRIQMRFPTLALEKEYAQVIGRSDCTGLTEWEVAHAILTKRENRHVARNLAWVLTVEGLETFLLMPRDAVDLDLLIESLRQDPSHADVDVVIGRRGPIAPPELCRGLQVPMVAFDQIYSFDVDTLLAAIPRPDTIPADRFGADAKDLFLRVMQMADNAGSTDEHRALNYLAVRYPALYETSAAALGRNSALASVNIQPSRLSGTRRILDVIFSFTHRTTDVTEKFFVRVDVTDEFPFLVTKMSHYYDR